MSKKDTETQSKTPNAYFNQERTQQEDYRNLLSLTSGILDQTRRRPRCTTLRQDIEGTLIKCASTGLEPLTIKSISDSLNQLSKNADLRQPEQDKTRTTNTHKQMLKTQHHQIPRGGLDDNQA